MSNNQTVVGGYELKNCVASGASTQIWEVTQQGSTVPFAMKLLLPDALKNAEAKNVLKHEFKVNGLCCVRALDVCLGCVDVCVYAVVVCVSVCGIFGFPYAPS